MAIMAALLLLLIANTSVLGSYSYKLNAVAAEGARQYTAGIWWLGMKRPNFNEQKAAVDVYILVTKLIESMGLQNAKVENLQVIPRHKMVMGRDITVVEVSFDASGLELVAGGLFPKVVRLHASGVSSDAEFAIPKHGMALLHSVYPDPLNPQVNIERAIRVPIYNATVGKNTPASSDPSIMHAGDSVDRFPQLTINLICPNSGELNVESTASNGSTIVSDKVAWGRP